MGPTRRLVAGGLGLALVLAGSASAADFSPKVSFGLSDNKVKANPEIAIHVEQDGGEEELAHVTLTIPAGFKLPFDSKIEDGDVLGTADITIDSGPGCAAGGPTTPLEFADRSIVERDRTEEQADEGVKAVWVVDLRPVTTIPLEVTGSVRKGFKLDGDIPANELTCPPFTFDSTIFSESEGGVPLLKNPRRPGVAVFSATFTSLSDSTKTIKQRIKIVR